MWESRVGYFIISWKDLEREREAENRRRIGRIDKGPREKEEEENLLKPPRPNCFRISCQINIRRS